MSRRPDESPAEWYERAIVANSIAAGGLEDLEDRSDVRPAERAAIENRATSAAADLGSALEALLAERRARQ